MSNLNPNTSHIWRLRRDRRSVCRYHPLSTGFTFQRSELNDSKQPYNPDLRSWEDQFPFVCWMLLLFNKSILTSPFQTGNIIICIFRSKIISCKGKNLCSYVQLVVSSSVEKFNDVELDWELRRQGIWKEISLARFWNLYQQQQKLFLMR
jgi:hypothetical protein